MENKRAKQLIKKYLDGTCTAEEKAILESWYLKESVDKASVTDHTNFLDIESEIWNKLEKNKKPKRTGLVWYAAAAAAVALITITVYFSFNAGNSNNHQLAEYEKILPGSNKAVLTLSNGSKIDLNNSEYGVFAKDAGVNIRKTADGQLAYDIIPQPLTSEISYNTIETPKGGQYQVSLPDGTKVWLNALSSLRFSTSFNGKERVVQVTGEAYFEVASNKEKPFIVNTDSQTIEVLGTHFNVNSYSDETLVKTSLVEGTVKVSSFGKTIIMKPGNQAISNKTDNRLSIERINVEDAIAWKNGYFQFSNENTESVMKKISRWYDVEIIYQKGFVDQQFVGTISKYEDVSKVLGMLELTGVVHFKQDGRRIFVMP